jgi:hypothetical protein
MWNKPPFRDREFRFEEWAGHRFDIITVVHLLAETTREEKRKDVTNKVVSKFRVY